MSSYPLSKVLGCSDKTKSLEEEAGLSTKYSLKPCASMVYTENPVISKYPIGPENLVMFRMTSSLLKPLTGVEVEYLIPIRHVASS